MITILGYGVEQVVRRFELRAKYNNVIVIIIITSVSEDEERCRETRTILLQKLYFDYKLSGDRRRCVW